MSTTLLDLVWIPLCGAFSAGLLAWGFVFRLAGTSPSMNRSFLPFLKSLKGKRPLSKAREASAGSWPGMWEKRKIRWKTARLREVLPQSLGMAVQALKAGQTFPQVLDYLSLECPEPLRGEWRRVCAEMGLGISAMEALSRMAKRFPGFDEFQRLLEAYQISQKTGANLARLLEILTEGMEEKNRLHRKMEAMTAQARLSGLLMGLLPVLLAVSFCVLDPDLARILFTQKAGWGILAASVFLEILGFLWIRQLLQLEF
jgi:tight adherence protein B